jgi:hypothetical protein
VISPYAPVRQSRCADWNDVTLDAAEIAAAFRRVSVTSARMVAASVPKRSLQSPKRPPASRRAEPRSLEVTAGAPTSMLA